MSSALLHDPSEIFWCKSRFLPVSAIWRSSLQPDPSNASKKINLSALNPLRDFGNIYLVFVVALTRLTAGFSGSLGLFTSEGPPLELARLLERIKVRYQLTTTMPSLS